MIVRLLLRFSGALMAIGGLIICLISTAPVVNVQLLAGLSSGANLSSTQVLLIDAIMLIGGLANIFAGVFLILSRTVR